MSEQLTTQKKINPLWLALGLMALGFGASVINWYSAITDNSYYISAALVMPFVGFLGLAMLVAPEAEKTGEPLAAPPSFSYKLRRNLARAIGAFGLIASGVNLALISGWLSI